MRKLTMLASAGVIATLGSLLVAAPAGAETGTFTEWNAIATGFDANGVPIPVQDFNPHITDLDRSGATGFTPNTPWYTIDNRTPGLPCALGHLEPGTNTLISWGYGFGEPVGVDVDDASGNVWHTVSGFMLTDDSGSLGGAHVAFKYPNATAACGGSPNCFRHFPNTSNSAGVTVDSVGNGYVAEIPFGGIGNILKITPAGSYTRWALPDSTFSNPRYLGFDSTEENLYFTVSSNRTINRLEFSTNTLTTWNMPETGMTSTSILDAVGLFVQNDDAIWYADTTGNRVGRLTPSTDTITTFTKPGMNLPQFIVVSSADQVFISEAGGNTVDVLEDDGTGTDHDVLPVLASLTPVMSSADPIDITRTPLSRVIDPVVTDVTGVDPPGIIRFPVPTPASEPIGITDVVETPIGPTETTFGIFGDEFASSKVFLFESIVIVSGPVAVDIDIKPGSDPNCFNNDGHGVIPVAILGSDTFDVASIDQTTLTLDNLAVAVRGKEKLMVHFEDVNGDGIQDLVIQFEDQDGVFIPGAGTATVTGALTDGTPFEGTDAICVTQ